MWMRLPWMVFTQSMIKVPANANITTSFGMAGNKLTAKGKLKDPTGTTAYDISYNTADDSYDADITANNLYVNNYVALDEPCHLTGHIRAKGRGTDFFSPKTATDISAQLDKQCKTCEDKLMREREELAKRDRRRRKRQMALLDNAFALALLGI